VLVSFYSQGFFLSSILAPRTPLTFHCRLVWQKLCHVASFNFSSSCAFCHQKNLVVILAFLFSFSFNLYLWFHLLLFYPFTLGRISKNFKKVTQHVIMNSLIKVIFLWFTLQVNETITSCGSSSPLGLDLLKCGFPIIG
jgi:hypothetical protein